MKQMGEEVRNADSGNRISGRVCAHEEGKCLQQGIEEDQQFEVHEYIGSPAFVTDIEVLHENKQQSECCCTEIKVQNVFTTFIKHGATLLFTSKSV